MNALLEARVLLRHLGLRGRRFDRSLLLGRLETRLGIAIKAVPDGRLPADGVSGARITSNGTHVVFYPASASDRQQLAIVCHECAHLLLEHGGRSVDEVLAGDDVPSPADELAAEALGAALVTFAERPERLQSLIQGRAPRGAARTSAMLGARLRAFYQPKPPWSEQR